MDLTTVEQLSSIGTTIGTILLVFMFWKTIQQLEETVKLSRLQAVHRFRPWVGPSSGIEFMRSTEEKEQFAITIKNYGELPASNVVAICTRKSEKPNRDILRSGGVDRFNLGPLLPNMEKRYWLFIDSDAVRNAKNGNGEIFIALYFEYEFPGGKSGYGMISHFDAKTNAFAHEDMWVD